MAEYVARRLSGRRPRLAVRYEIGEPLGASRPGTLQHFLVERYFLHLERWGRLWSVQVHHAPYPVQRARVLDLRDELIAATGLPEPAGLPPLVHYSPGVDVEIFAASTLTAVAYAPPATPARWGHRPTMSGGWRH